MLMIMKCAILLVSVFLTYFSSVALGRIGESPTQCASRYGEETSREVTEEGLLEVTYKKWPLIVSVSFEKDKAVSIFYVRGSDDGEPASFSHDELMKLLTANGSQTNWDIEEGPGNIHFVNKRDNLHAVTSPEYKGLSVLCSKYERKQIEKENKQKLKELEGF
jgi:hypothetical protein